MPSNDPKGRVHSSTVTVATTQPSDATVAIDPRDVKVEWYSGSGPGGQNRNKVQACARLTHVPTGIVRTAQTRSRETSYREAIAALSHAVASGVRSDQAARENDARRGQIGSGQRGDKDRTFRFQDGTARDHETGRKARLSDVMSGRFDLLRP